jgi:hypothetical protein
MFLIYNLKPQQSISILTVYGMLGEGGYSVRTLQHIAILTAYSTLGFTV